MNERCPYYCGLNCVNGNCPSALAEEYPEYGYTPCNCESCGYYEGCEDCCFEGEPECCFKSEKDEVKR